MGYTVDTNGNCSDCIHCRICKNQDNKQKLMGQLMKIDWDIKPFKLNLKCPDYLATNKIGGPIYR